jgi:hypothetical protein
MPRPSQGFQIKPTHGAHAGTCRKQWFVDAAARLEMAITSPFR